MDFFTQNVWVPAPTLTEKNLPDQSGKVFIVTGGYAGVGMHLSKILFQHNGVVYIAGRSKSKADKASEEIKKAFPDSKGRVEFLQLDLSDLTKIEGAARTFMSQEQRLDVLTNNAGVMVPPSGSKTEQGYELQLGTNCLGPYLFTKCLMPILVKTAAQSPPGSVRVTWAGSYAINAASPKNGVVFENGAPKFYNSQGVNYAQSKAGNLLLASELARRFKKDGIISVAFNPGNLRSELQRHIPAPARVAVNAICWPPVYGAYTELTAALGENINLENSGSYIIPWGRVSPPAGHILPALKDLTEGGTGIARAFWDWCDEETSKYITHADPPA